ncbi:MAG: alkaline phosphatase family protein, partial [Streptosporangiaceae bacterium]
MTDERRPQPTLPAYGEETLADLASSLLASLGVAAEANPLGLPETPRACLLIVDGLGWELLRGHQAAAPFLA